MERKSASIFSNCPWETGSKSVLQPFGQQANQHTRQPIGPYNKATSNPKPTGSNAVTVYEETRDGQPKAYIPNFFYRAPFGYPRYKDLNYYRQLAASIYVDMCVTAIIDEVCSIQYEIVAEDRAGNAVPGKDADVERVQDFFENPNTNKESWEMIVRMMLPDLLELNSGVMVKIFNMFGEMVEICARDGMAFTKNPDPYGFYTSRADIILMKNILGEGEEQTQHMDYPAIQAEMTAEDAHEEGAYFQYGFNTGARPIPFGRREIVWFEKKVRTNNLYGRSSMEVLAKTVQTLIYAVESQLEYFNDNSIPPGVLGLEGMNATDLKTFGQQWIQQQKVQDDLGNWKRANHKLPMVNKMPKFERLGFTNQELELIESQKWWSKLVWGAFGITATELGFTEDAKGSANQIVQTSVAKKRIIYPLLRLIEYHVNTEIIPEFGVEGVRYKYKIFDIDEETKKWGLYKLQTESDLKTINEVRNAEGLDDVEWGDKNVGERSPNQGTNINVGDPRQQDADKINRDSANNRDKMTGKPAKGDKPDDIKKKKDNPEADAETEKIKLNKVKPENMARHKFKPAKWTHPNGHPRCLLCGNEERIGGYCDARTEKKAQTTDSPTVLGSNEEMSTSEKKLKKQITDLLKSNKERVFELLEDQGKPEQLLQIKSIDDLPGIIKKIFSIFTFKKVVDEVISFKFNFGWEESEKQIDKNVPMNNKALEFLQDHTFDNIKDMTEEISNDLKAELSRGIINGEGLVKLKARVTKVFNVGNNRAEMIARTEVNNAENQGKLLSMKGSGLKYKKKWVSAHDARTSNICKRLDGQTVGLDENFVDKTSGWSGQAPSAHVNCRSTLIFIEDED